MPVATPQDPRLNRILAGLKDDQLSGLMPELDLVELTQGQLLYEAGDSIGYAYFPVTSIVSIASMTSSGATAELALTGNDGLVGIQLVYGDDLTPHRVTVQRAGSAYRIRAEVLRWELATAGELQRLTWRYAQMLMLHMAQTALCNRHHALEQQLCRLLLLYLDRTKGNQLDMTQSMIAGMLGVRREGVTEAAGKLSAAGIIDYRRGHIVILDRARLEARACECYGVVKGECARLLALNSISQVIPLGRGNPATLRQRAETQFRNSPPEAPRGALETSRTLYELQVHQIELELQNEEITRAYTEADEQRQHARDVYGFAPVAYISVSELSAITQINLAGAILLGIKASECLRHRFSAFVVASDLPVFNRFLDGVLRNRTRTTCQISLIANSHRQLAVVQIDAVPDESGSECRMVVSNITEREAILTALAASESNLQEAQHTVHVGNWTFDHSTGKLYGSRELYLIYGLPFCEAGPSVDDVEAIIHPEDLARVRVVIAAMIQDGMVINMTHRLLMADGLVKFIHVHGARNRSEPDQPLTYRGTCQDVTKSVLVENLLRLNEARLIEAQSDLDAAQGLAKIGNWKWDLLTGIHTWSKELFSIYGCDPAMAPPSYAAMRRYFAEEDWLRMQLAIANCRSGGGTYELETPILSFDNRKRWVQIFGTARRNEAGEIVALHGTVQDISERKQLEERIRHLGFYDDLTNLPNRRLLTDRLAHDMAVSRRSGAYGALVFLDLDNFKPLNDRHGHEIGDLLLIEVAARIRLCVREMDSVARFGGDEFVIILSVLDNDKNASAAQAASIAKKLCTALAEPYRLLDIRTQKSGQLIEHSCTASIGIALFLGTDTSHDEVLRQADLAMYQAKIDGRNTIRLFGCAADLPLIPNG